MAMFERTTKGQKQAHEGAQQWLGALENLAQQIQRQQQASQQMVQELMDTYIQLLNTPTSYLSDQADQQRQSFQQWVEQAQHQQQAFRQQAQQQQQAFQQMTQEAASTYIQLFNIPASYARKSLRGVQYPIEGYDELNVEQISERLEGLSTEELRMIRDYEERNSNRDTLLQQLDRKIRSG
jgi:ElaB/YqjD/DUF883 family membrane-anchored ribosome-binding protein